MHVVLLLTKFYVSLAQVLNILQMGHSCVIKKKKEFRTIENGLTMVSTVWKITCSTFYKSAKTSQHDHQKLLLK